MALKPPPKWGKRTESGSIVVRPVEVARSYQDPRPEASTVPSASALTTQPSAMVKDKHLSSSPVKKEAVTVVRSGDTSPDTGRIVISHPAKIFTIAGPKKFLDFNSNLIKAYPKDYAMLHGCGGKDYAPNSTITVRLYDYSNGKERAVDVKFQLDVAEIDSLRTASMNAMFGLLRPKQPNNGSSLISAQEKLKLLAKRGRMPDGNIPITPSEVEDLLSDLHSFRANSNEDYEGFPIVREKSDVRKKRESDAFIPVSKLTINFSPVYRGTATSYPWYIRIENFWAPAVTEENGTVYPDCTKATGKRSASINVSKEDFQAAMTHISSFIREWEHRSFKTIDAACTQAEAARMKWLEEKQQENNKK